jgi:hypothetical protein
MDDLNHIVRLGPIVAHRTCEMRGSFVRHHQKIEDQMLFIGEQFWYIHAVTKDATKQPSSHAGSP